MNRRRTGRIFAVPLLLGVATVTGLIAGLIGDGGWDTAAGLALALPLVVTAWYWRRAGPSSRA